MKNISIVNSSISYKNDFLDKNFENEIVFEISEEFNKIDIKKPPLNFISNKKDFSQQALWFGPVAYKYGKYQILEPFDMPDYIIDLERIVSNACNKEEGYFNSVYVNKYIDAGIGKHHDNDLIFKKDKSWNGGKDIIVAVYSIGKEAIISLYNGYNGPKIKEINVINNSLYIMNENFQNTLYHEVGKSKGERFSFTFRRCV